MQTVLTHLDFWSSAFFIVLMYGLLTATITIIRNAIAIRETEFVDIIYDFFVLPLRLAKWSLFGRKGSDGKKCSLIHLLFKDETFSRFID